MDNTLLQLQCSDNGAVMNDIVFSSYGDARGTCPSFTRGSCDAATSVAVVTALCIGKSSCQIFPNTSTFGDPCFGTAKTLSVVATCSSGSGVSTCGLYPPPPVLQNFTASVSVDFASVTSSVIASASVQVVSQHALWRTSPIASTAWATFAQLGAKNVRWVPWVPYAQHGVAELAPPQPGGRLCGPQNWEGGRGQIEPVTLDCGPLGGSIESVDFASFGNPGGNCGGYAAGSCSAANSSAVVESLCVGKKSCIVPTETGGIFGTPCAVGAPSWLAVQLQCSNHSAIMTSWNFTLPDQFLSDFWEAAGGEEANPLPNFSTQPTWLYSPTDWNWNADPSQPWDYSRGGFSACNNTLLGEYYGRLYAYFINGSMVDEAGVTHTRPGGGLAVHQIEVFNEVDYEHGYTVDGYTAAFDAVVRNVRKFDTEKKIRFVGLNLPNIDGASKIAAWATYFLNISNHAPDIGTDALSYIGYHAYPTNGGYTKDPSTFSRMFDYADSFVSGVLEVDAVIRELSPSTFTYLDETGADMDNVLDRDLSPPDNAPRYWVAAASYFAYVFARVANESKTVVQIGASQLMDGPGQEPSVTLLDWTTGLGTARFWVVKMLQVIQPSDVFVQTSVTIATPGADPDALFAVGIVSHDMDVKRIMLINKRNAWANVTVSCGQVTCNCESLTTIDEFTRLSPARIDSCGANGVVEMAPYATTIMLSP
jgi:hypothetical protein